MKFSTKAIHVGQEPDPTTGAVITPIYQTSTYVQEGIGKHKGYEYARTGNPTRTALEQCLASLENAKYGLCFASGLAAEMNIMYMLKQGDHVVVGEDVYGGTYRLFQRVMTKYGLKFSFVDSRDLSNVEKAINKETRMLWLETPTNPMLQLVDIQAATKLARSKGLITVVDNTFASPYLQNPLDLGADIVVHSTTKYIGGHSDVVGGALMTSNTEMYEELKFHQNACGGVPGPQDCFLTMRGVKTLAVRMEQHQKNAMEIAKLLSGHEGLEKVIYPGLADHPHHELAKKQMRGFGGMLSIVVKGGQDAAQRFMTGTKLFSLAESLGGVESLMCHPSTMTHGSIPKEDREARGITDGLVRLSVGIEDVEDLVEDIKTALAKISAVTA
ncbi:MAG: cystathionine gamma-synthase [Candidatus Melainabacteria bacterium]|nr:MAG: cystathionine gamma-synthase [Candidatus Melainabacteria bacterium]